MAFTEDLSDFFDTEHGFAVTVVYDGNVSVEGIFDAEYFEPSAGMAGVQSSQPVFLCMTADVEDAAHGETLEIDDDTYHIVGVEPDGTGITMLRLEKQ